VDLLTVKDVSELAGVSAARIRQLCAEGRFSGAQKLGRDWIIPRADVDRWLKTDRDRRFAFYRDKGED